MSRWRKCCLYGALALLIFLVFLGLYFNRQRRHGAEELRAVLAELDEADPDWRLEELEARRRVVPDEENGALQVVKAARELPKDWNSEVLNELLKAPPPAQFPDETAKRLTGELQPLAKALALARAMKDFPHGRYAISYAPNWLGTLMVDQQRCRSVATLLQLDVCASIHEGQTDQAWRSARALLNAGRSLGDEPTLISQIIRMSFPAVAVQCLERTLAHGTAPDAALAAMQQALADDARDMLFLTGMRGERAGMHRLFDHLENGSVPIAIALENFGQAKPPRPPNWWDYLTDMVAARMVYRSHAWIVRHQTAVIAAAAKPDPERYEALREIDLDIRDSFDGGADRDLLLARLLVPAVLKGADAERRVDTLLHCAVAALAAERFRLSHQRWPASLDDLVKEKLVPEPPIDLYDGQSVRFRRTPDGLVIHSITQDGDYQGDALDRLEDFDPQHFRLEFRLWDPARRRQPPLH